jgi:hypothetical protein
MQARSFVDLRWIADFVSLWLAGTVAVGLACQVNSLSLVGEDLRVNRLSAGCELMSGSNDLSCGRERSCHEQGSCGTKIEALHAGVGTVMGRPVLHRRGAEPFL